MSHSNQANLQRNQEAFSIIPRQPSASAPDATAELERRFIRIDVAVSVVGALLGAAAFPVAPFRGAWVGFLAGNIVIWSALALIVVAGLVRQALEGAPAAGEVSPVTPSRSGDEEAPAASLSKVAAAPADDRDATIDIHPARDRHPILQIAEEPHQAA